MDGPLCTGILSDVIQPKHCTHCIETEKKADEMFEAYFRRKLFRNESTSTKVLSVNIAIELFYCIRKLGSLIVQKKEEKQQRKYCVWLNIFCDFKYQAEKETIQDPELRLFL